MTEIKPFFGYTNADGTRTHDSPANWVFGTVGPVSEYSFRYAPDSAVYEKQPKVRAVAAKDVEVFDLSGAGVFSAMASFLVTIGDKS